MPKSVAATALAAARHWRAQLDDPMIDGPMIDGPTRRTYLAAVRSCEAILAQTPRRAPAWT